MMMGTLCVCGRGLVIKRFDGMARLDKVWPGTTFDVKELRPDLVSKAPMDTSYLHVITRSLGAVVGWALSCGKRGEE